jgi:hypothetical protein
VEDAPAGGGFSVVGVFVEPRLEVELAVSLIYRSFELWKVVVSAGEGFWVGFVASVERVLVLDVSLKFRPCGHSWVIIGSADFGSTSSAKFSELASALFGASPLSPESSSSGTFGPSDIKRNEVILVRLVTLTILTPDCLALLLREHVS